MLAEYFSLELEMIEDSLCLTGEYSTLIPDWLTQFFTNS